MEELF